MKQFVAASVFLMIVVGVALTAGSQAAEETHFRFEKQGPLIATPEGMPAPGPYYTCLVDMRAVSDFPYAYALYFSTDHTSGPGGVWLYLCKGLPSVSKNWVSYDEAVAAGAFDYLAGKPAKNPIFVDTVQGRQTETPCVNVVGHEVYMTYHNCGAGHGQSTLLATSPDGVNFSRIHGKKNSIILDYDPKKAPGDGHTGYFRWRANPFPKVAYAYVGYSLHGGGDNFFGAMWGSQDAIHWDKIQLFDAIEGAWCSGGGDCATAFDRSQQHYPTGKWGVCRPVFSRQPGLGHGQAAAGIL